MKTGKNVRHPVFWLSCLLFVAHQIIQKGFNINIPWIHSYLDDVLAMPILLTLILFERRKFFAWGDDFVFSALESLALVVSLSLVFELVFPAFSTKFTFDWRDFIAYALGGVVFYKYLNA